MERIAFLDIFNDLLEENNLNRKQFSEKSEIPYTTIIGWTKLNRLPDYTALIKIADFFHCSLDYLMGRGEDLPYRPTPMQCTPNEQALLKAYRNLPDEDQKLISSLIQKLNKSK